MISACFLARFQELQAYDRKESLACKLYESIILRISIGKFMRISVPKTIFLSAHRP
jgi:hypothetical protein